MRVEWQEIPGVVLSQAQVFSDDRGSFTKLASENHGFTSHQVASAFNQKAGTIRGMHWQTPPHAETKMLWVSSGKVLDVLVDMRPESATFGSWTGVELDDSTPHTLTVPTGVAHGYQTLVDNTSLIYLINGHFAPESGRTLLWNDQTVGIDWPLTVSRISEADQKGMLWEAP